MEPRLLLKMSQRLVLTPTLQQAIKLLLYSRQELVQYVRQEMLENPTLEEVPPDEALPAEVDGESLPDISKDEEQVKDVVEDVSGEGEREWGDFLSEFDNGYEPYQFSDSQEFENVVQAGTTLQEHLLQQLNVSLGDSREKGVGFEIIGNIDESGYLRADTEELAGQLGVTVTEVQDVLRKVQEFDPPGVGARDLAECLLIQLAGLDLKGGLEEKIIQRHLRDLETRRMEKIAREERTSVEEVMRAAKVIAGLEPHPGRSFSRESVQYVVPDINIYKVGSSYRVQLINEGLPQIRINGFYRRLYRSGTLTESDKEFLDKKVNSARWLIKSILQRQQTILKVARSIVEFQREFLDQGIKYLKPLVLRTVAEDINMHESTVSRVTSKKYAQTPQGILELKFFFNSGINRRGGESMASVSVMDLIRKMIAEEDSRKPLSDLEIVRRLQEEHSLSIARRTIAKYRGQLSIMPASRRRQVF